jgi:glycosyltransferase involved in cell wall biosynthesis
MRIVLLHYTAPPVVGGVETVIGHQARLMAGSGYEVRIAAGRGSQVDDEVDFVSIPQADSQNSEILKIKKDLDQGRVPAGFAGMVDGLTDSLEKILAGADWLIAHNVCSLNKNLALTAAVKRIAERAPRPRIALWHHDLAWTTPRYREELHDGHPWDLLKTAWPGTTQVTISEFRRRELADLFDIPGDQIRVIPNGLDAARFFKFERATEEFVNKLAILDGWPLLLLPVRITPRKNLELALQVLADLRREFPRAILLVTGPLGAHNPANQEYFDKLLALRHSLGLEGAAHFLAEHTSEYLPDQVIADFYRLADLLFMPSQEEGFGIPVLEAGLNGLPVFCTDIPPLRELGGRHVNYFDLDAQPAEIAGSMAGYLSSSSVFGLRERVRAEFIWTQVHQKHIIPLLNSNGG